MIGSQPRILEIERRLELLARENEALRRRLTAAEQLARQSWSGRPADGGGSAGRVCVADGDIDPRTGATAGAGQVIAITVDDSTGAMATSGDPFDVWNPSVTEAATGVGILAGTVCWAEKDARGVWIVAPLECDPTDDFDDDNGGGGEGPGEGEDPDPDGPEGGEGGV